MRFDCLLIAVLIVALLGGCSKTEAEKPADDAQAKIIAERDEQIAALTKKVNGAANTIGKMNEEADNQRSTIRRLESQNSSLSNQLGMLQTGGAVSVPPATPSVASPSTTTTAAAPLAAGFEAEPTLFPPMYKVSEDFAPFVGKCVCFKNAWFDADVEVDDGIYEIDIRDDRGTSYIGFKEELLFTCSKAMADIVRENFPATTAYQSNIYCKIGTRNTYDKKVAATALIYKVDILSVGGDVHTRVTESGVQKLIGNKRPTEASAPAPSATPRPSGTSLFNLR